MEKELARGSLHRESSRAHPKKTLTDAESTKKKLRLDPSRPELRKVDATKLQQMMVAYARSATGLHRKPQPMPGAYEPPIMTKMPMRSHRHSRIDCSIGSSGPMAWQNALATKEMAAAARKAEMKNAASALDSPV